MAKKAIKKTTKKAAKRSATARSTTKRELIDTGTDKRYVKRNADGTWKESDDVGRAGRADRRTAARTTVKPGHGDQGDQAPRARKAAKKR